MTIQINPSSPQFPTKMPTAIFLDSGGVINDNRRRAPQWLHHLGEFFPTTHLGGTAVAWSNANRQVVKTFFNRWHEYMQQATDEASSNSENDGEGPNVAVIFERIHLTEWMKQMCNCVAESLPELKEHLPGLSDQNLFVLAKQAYQYTLQRVQADFPGAVDTIRKLSEETVGTSDGEMRKRYRLFTSSGDSSDDLEVILKGIGAFEYFKRIYGSDRVNYLKVSPVFYERIFAREGICVVSRDASTVGEAGADQRVLEQEESINEVIVIDDSEKALKWARSLGARTVIIDDEDRVDLSLPHLAHIDYRLSSLSDLPALLESWKDHFERKKVESQQ
ncbi:hypothetical protein BG005_004931 [Podila minutissima]|nr:hypothetical protein BG005_004931 [Podila minutissima]